MNGTGERKYKVLASLAEIHHDLLSYFYSVLQQQACNEVTIVGPTIGHQKMSKCNLVKIFNNKIVHVVVDLVVQANYTQLLSPL
jgi:hypothetical protein